MPGVPDVYQGTELWDNSLVDPDNRRPVDFDVRRELLAASTTAGGRRSTPTDAAKLLVISRTLRLRRDRPELFTGYRPVPAHRAGGRARAWPSTAAARSRVATRLPLRTGTRTAAGGTPPVDCPFAR